MEEVVEAWVEDMVVEGNMDVEAFHAILLN